MLGETEVMIPDTMRRLAKGVDELRAFIASNGADAAIAASQQLAEAKALVSAAAAGEGAQEEDEEAI